MPLKLEQQGHAASRILIVVHHENTQSRLFFRRRSCGCRIARRRDRQHEIIRRHERQTNRELTAAAETLTAGFDRAAVHLNQAAHDDEAYAEAAVCAAVEPLLVRRRLEQTLEHVL